MTSVSTYVPIHFGEEDLLLLPQRALYWPRRRILALSDVHLGKAESFQAAGVPVPSSVHQDDLRRMDAILNTWDVERVLVLGDWIHKKNSWTQQLMSDLDVFFQRHIHTHWTLLIGNHERGSHEYLKRLPFELIDGDLQIDGLTFTHGHSHGQKLDPSRSSVIQGHIHPVIVLREGPINLRLPCYLLNGGVLTLPSFGVFTGGYEIEKQRKQKIWAVTPDDVFEVPV